MTGRPKWIKISSILSVFLVISFAINIYAFYYDHISDVSVEGVVLVDGKICSNATISLGNTTTSSCQDGSFTFDNVKRGHVKGKVIINGTPVSEQYNEISGNPEFVTFNVIDYYNTKDQK